MARNSFTLIFALLAIAALSITGGNARKVFPRPIKNLALSGGGVYVTSQVGALKFLETVPNFAPERIVGNGNSAILGALYAANFSIAEIEAIYSQPQFGAYNYSCEAVLPNLFNRYGIVSVDGLSLLVNNLLTFKLGVLNPTFSDLKRDLTITAYNFNKQELEYFNKQNTPNMTIRQAVRWSGTAPWIYATDRTVNDVYFDGGIVELYPINHFNNRLTETIGINFNPGYDVTNINNSSDISTGWYRFGNRHNSLTRRQELSTLTVDIPAPYRWFEHTLTVAENLMFIDAGCQAAALKYGNGTIPSFCYSS